MLAWFEIWEQNTKYSNIYDLKWHKEGTSEGPPMSSHAAMLLKSLLGDTFCVGFLWTHRVDPCGFTLRSHAHSTTHPAPPQSKPGEDTQRSWVTADHTGLLQGRHLTSTHTWEVSRAPSQGLPLLHKREAWAAVQKLSPPVPAPFLFSLTGISLQIAAPRNTALMSTS